MPWHPGISRAPGTVQPGKCDSRPAPQNPRQFRGTGQREAWRFFRPQGSKQDQIVRLTGLLGHDAAGHIVAFYCKFVEVAQ